MTVLKWIATAAILGASAVFVGSAATAAGGTPIPVKGTQTVVDEQQGKYAMLGSLVGAWNTTAFSLVYEGSGGEVAATGKETFNGCLDTDRSRACDPGEPSGTMRFTFVYWATYSKAGKLVRGECVHPVIGGTGAFRKAKGVIHFWDRPGSKGVVTTYKGTLELSAAAASSHAAPASRSLAAARPARGACGG